jgi:hypothetical protein
MECKNKPCDGHLCKKCGTVEDLVIEALDNGW